jgi:hypothetical protein
MPAKGGALELSHPARQLVGRVEGRPDDQYSFCWLPRLKPGAGMRYPAVADRRDENLCAHGESLRPAGGHDNAIDMPWHAAAPGCAFHLEQRFGLQRTSLESKKYERRSDGITSPDQLKLTPCTVTFAHMRPL